MGFQFLRSWFRYNLFLGSRCVGSFFNSLAKEGIQAAKGTVELEVERDLIALQG
jgi:hypothetical protein